DATPYHNRALLYDDAGDFERAIPDYDNAIRLDPSYANAYSNRGNAHRAMGNFERAIADYSDAIRLDPDNPNRVRSRGYAYFAHGDFARAAADLQRVIEARDEIYPMIYHYLARERSGQNARAELEANAGRLKSRAWPYPVVELYLGRRQPQAVIDAANGAEER